jgi:hypothetical protein
MPWPKLVGWMWRRCRNGDHPLRAWIPAAHAAAGRPPRRPEWGLPASILANLQCSIDSARLSLRSARASDQIGKDRRWGRPSGDGDGRRRASHGGGIGERRGRLQRQVRRWRLWHSVNEIMQGQVPLGLSPVALGGSWAARWRKPGPPVGVLGH